MIFKRIFSLVNLVGICWEVMNNEVIIGDCFMRVLGGGGKIGFRVEVLVFFYWICGVIYIVVMRRCNFDIFGFIFVVRFIEFCSGKISSCL